LSANPTLTCTAVGAGFSLIVLVVNAYYTWITMNTQLADGFVVIWPQSSPDAFGIFNVAVAILTKAAFLEM
jgi:hypothetical protein